MDARTTRKTFEHANGLHATDEQQAHTQIFYLAVHSERQRERELNRDTVRPSRNQYTTVRRSLVHSYTRHGRCANDMSTIAQRCCTHTDGRRFPWNRSIRIEYRVRSMCVQRNAKGNDRRMNLRRAECALHIYCVFVCVLPFGHVVFAEQTPILCCFFLKSFFYIALWLSSLIVRLLLL